MLYLPVLFSEIKEFIFFLMADRILFNLSSFPGIVNPRTLSYDPLNISYIPLLSQWAAHNLVAIP